MVPNVDICLAGKYQPTPIGFPLITLTSKQKNVDIKLLTPTNI